MRKIKNKLSWIIVAVPAVCFFLKGMCIENKAPWFMASFTYLVAVFTFLLWRATKEYTEVNKEYTKITRELLNQSKEVFKQSRIAFLANIVKDLTIYAWEVKKSGKAPVDYIFNISMAFGKIDKEIAREVWEAMQIGAGETKLGKGMKKKNDRFRKELG